MRKSQAIVLILGLFAGREAVAQTCTGSANGLAFGTYQPLTGSPSASTSTVTVTCNPGVVSLLVSYSIQIGTGTGGSFAGRSMHNGGANLGYQIYTNALYNQVWGDGTGGTSQESDGYLLGVVLPVIRNYTAYGVIPGGRNVAIGVYGDTVAVLITY